MDGNKSKTIKKDHQADRYVNDDLFWQNLNDYKTEYLNDYQADQYINHDQSDKKDLRVDQYIPG